MSDDNVLPFEPNRRGRDREPGQAGAQGNAGGSDGEVLRLEVEQDEATRQRIRSSLDESLLVEAAAGTGKTTVLVERLVAVLAQGRARVDTVVAVTFTRKAAGELKLRLRQQLDRARSAASDERTRRNLEQSIARLEEARIGTIHSFCADILRERPVEAQIDPGFQEVADGEDQAIFRVAFDRFIQEQLEAMRPGLRRALSRLALESTFQGTPVQRLREAAWSLVEWRDFPAQWRRDPFEREWAVDELVKRVHRLAKMARAGRPGDRLVRALEPVTLLDTWIDRSEAEQRRDYDGLEARLIDARKALKRNERDKGSGKFAEAIPREQVLEERRLLLDNLEKFADAADADLAAALHDELLEVVERYEDQKRRSARLDFNDLLLRARSLLRSDPSVRSRLQRELTHVFVDEFQDTDPMQAEILLLLSADDPEQDDWRRVRPVPGKLFLVGDPKQSIYRFRRADVRLYQEIKERLSKNGVEVLYLRRSFRALPSMQRLINAAFRSEMDGDEGAGNPEYLDLVEARPEPGDQPSLVVLPPPSPYGYTRLANFAIENCQPSVVGGYVAWLLGSDWSVEDPVTHDRREIRPSDICLLFRRFVSWGSDVTRPYTSALEAHGVPHVLVGSRTFHQREEVETLRAALTAVEWPDDELSVYATLRGSLFAFTDDALLRARVRFEGRLHPFRIRALDLTEQEREELEPDLEQVVEVLYFLGELHRRRNHRAIVETVQELLGFARAHAAFALRPAGQQVLSNVDRVCDLARRYELSGGRSFRGFVELLDEEAEKPNSSESPVVEEEAEGVRLMTVHNAKGLEFPIVVLVDMTANLHTRKPQRTLDAGSGLCVQKLLGCTPIELLEREREELRRERAEGLRVAYVAATRARDLLVVPGVGDEARSGWVEPLNKAIYPDSPRARRSSEAAPRCPDFGDKSVLERPVDYDGRPEFSVKPGVHRFGRGNDSYQVVWWDPAVVSQPPDTNFGLRQEEILMEDEGGQVAEHNLGRYQKWSESRAETSRMGALETLRIEIATEVEEEAPGQRSVDVARVERRSSRPAGERGSRSSSGLRYGSLVHAVLRDVPLRAPSSERSSAITPALRLRQLAHSHGRRLECPEAEITSAVQAIEAALEHPILLRAAQLEPAAVRREMGFVVPLDEQRILEGTIDLALEEQDEWLVVDFKTDAEIGERLADYQRQVGWYLFALERLTAKPARGVLLVL